MFTLGIDPGAKNTGWCLLRFDSRGAVYVAGGSGLWCDLRVELCQRMGQATIIGLEVLHNTRAFDTNGTSEVIGAIRERLHVHGRQSAYLELTSKDWRKAYLGKASGVDFRETYNHVRSCVTGFPELGRVRDGKTPKRALDHITDAACVALYVHDFPDGRKVA